jgi:uncharacterized protein (DUF433 family)
MAWQLAFLGTLGWGGSIEQCSASAPAYARSAYQRLRAKGGADGGGGAYRERTARRVLPAAMFVGKGEAGDGTLRGVSRLERITVDPAICHGQPTVRGLRYPVENLLELLASGMTIDEIIEDYPDLERDDLLAALEFGALVSGQRRVVPLGAA